LGLAFLLSTRRERGARYKGGLGRWWCFHAMVANSSINQVYYL
jgi:hypothetical protein